jgi:hypothetical protein
MMETYAFKLNKLAMMKYSKRLDKVLDSVVVKFKR